MGSGNRVEIMYFGYDYYDLDFINSQQMRDVIAEHEYMQVVAETVDPNTGEDMLKILSFPVTRAEADGPIMILDTRLDEAHYMDHALLINHEDDAYAVNPSPEFIEILKMMQADYARNGKELFVDMSSDDYEGERWSWEFDFTTGKYITP